LILSISLCIMTLPTHSAIAKLIACVGASNTYGYALVNRESDCYVGREAYEWLSAYRRSITHTSVGFGIYDNRR